VYPPHDSVSIALAPLHQHPQTLNCGDPRRRLLTVVDFADEAFIENADVQSGVGRRGDGVFVTVTLIGVKPGAAGVGYSVR
jgi:hypothetical protein